MTADNALGRRGRAAGVEVRQRVAILHEGLRLLGGPLTLQRVEADCGTIIDRPAYQSRR